MVEKRRLKQSGHSIVVALNKDIIENVYHLKKDDEVTVDYAYPKIIIIPENLKEKIQKKQ